MTTPPSHGPTADEVMESLSESRRLAGKASLVERERRQWTVGRVPVTVIRYAADDAGVESLGWVCHAGPYHDASIEVTTTEAPPPTAQGPTSRPPDTDALGRLTAQLMVIMSPLTRH